MITIDDAILHCEEVAEKCSDSQCGTDHKQLADWLKELKRLKTAQPERKTGRWEDINKNYYCRISGRCSACGWEAHLYEDDVVGMPYCPNCGAKMEEKDGTVN